MNENMCQAQGSRLFVKKEQDDKKDKDVEADDVIFKICFFND